MDYTSCIIMHFMFGQALHTFKYKLAPRMGKNNLREWKLKFVRIQFSNDSFIAL